MPHVQMALAIEKSTDSRTDCCAEDGAVADGLVAAVEVVLDRLMDSPFGKRFRHLDPDARSVTLAILGEPEDDRPEWPNLGVVVSSMILNDMGSSMLIGSC